MTDFHKQRIDIEFCHILCKLFTETRQMNKYYFTVVNVLDILSATTGMKE